MPSTKSPARFESADQVGTGHRRRDHQKRRSLPPGPLLREQIHKPLGRYLPLAALAPGGPFFSPLFLGVL